MATDRIRLSDRARKRLFDLADQADLEPSFLLEYLINRHGKDAMQLLSGQSSSLVTQTHTNAPYPVIAPHQVTQTSPNPPAPVNAAQNGTGTTTQQQNLAKWLESDA